jgi:hypothetical protein
MMGRIRGRGKRRAEGRATTGARARAVQMAERAVPLYHPPDWSGTARRGDPP